MDVTMEPAPTVQELASNVVKFKKKLRPSSNQFGALWLGTMHDTPVVYKRAKSQTDRVAVSQIANEAKLLGLISQSPSPNVMRLMGYSHGKRNYYRNQSELTLALEQFDGDLGDLIGKNLRVSGTPCFLDRLDMCIQIAKGLRDLARMNIIHKDVKKENILFQRDMSYLSGYRCALGDFGCADTMESGDVNNKDNVHSVESAVCGNLAGRAPEVFAQKVKIVSRQVRLAMFSQHYDVYSFAVCIWELLCMKDLEQEDWGTWGVAPYDEFESAVLKGGRPSLVSLAEYPAIQGLLRECWSFDDTASPIWNQAQRPGWDVIISRLEGIAFQLRTAHGEKSKSCERR